MFKKVFQETLLILVHYVARGNHGSVINEGLYCYLNKLHKIKSSDKGSLHRCLRGLIFSLYALNTDPVDRTDIDQSVVDIGREFPFTIYLSPEISR